MTKFLIIFAAVCIASSLARPHYGNEDHALQASHHGGQHGANLAIHPPVGGVLGPLPGGPVPSGHVSHGGKLGPAGGHVYPGHLGAAGGHVVPGHVGPAGGHVLPGHVGPGGGHVLPGHVGPAPGHLGNVGVHGNIGAPGHGLGPKPGHALGPQAGHIGLPQPGHVGIAHVVPPHGSQHGNVGLHGQVGNLYGTVHGVGHDAGYGKKY